MTKSSTCEEVSFDTAFRLGTWLVKPSLGRICCDGEERRLRPKNMDALVYLAQRAGRVVSKQEILDGVWGTRNVAEGVLSRSIADLRVALDDDAREPRFIETIPKRGYCMVAAVAPAEYLGSCSSIAMADSRSSLFAVEARFRLLLGEHEIVLSEGGNMIGRAPDAALQICHPRVSRHHAMVTVTGQTAILEDLGSKNGTLLNGRRLDKPVALNDGDEILIRSTRIIVRDLAFGSTEASDPTRLAGSINGRLD